MKVLSLWQPWASLMADGIKPWETRHWPAPESLIGQEYAIHAAMKVDKKACAEFGYNWMDIPRGRIVSVHILKECRRFTEGNVLKIRDSYGDYSPGRYGWMSPLVCKLIVPIPAKGHQGLWNCTEMEEVAYQKALDCLIKQGQETLGSALGKILDVFG